MKRKRLDINHRKENEEIEIIEPQQTHSSNNQLIPTDVTAEILSRLPIKSIGRFISVSKSWRDVITGRRFSSLHAKNKPFSTFYNATRSVYDSQCRHYVFEVDKNGDSTTTTVRPRIDEPSPEIEIVGSCNGLLCLLESRPGLDAVTILNPITSERNVVMLPNPITSEKERRRVYEFHKFVYSPSSDEYKVFKCVTRPYKPDIWGAFAIFTVGVDRRWRELSPQLFSDKLLYHHRDAVFCDGALHWLVNEGAPSSNHILAFDVAREDARKVPIRRRIGPNTTLSVFENRISLYDDRRPGRGNVAWDVEGSWSRVVVPTESPISAHNKDYENEFFEPLHCATKYGGVLLAGSNWGHTWLYCPKRERLTDIGVVRFSVDSLFEFAPTFSSIEQILCRKSSAQHI